MNVLWGVEAAEEEEGISETVLAMFLCTSISCNRYRSICARRDCRDKMMRKREREREQTAREEKRHSDGISKNKRERGKAVYLLVLLPQLGRRHVLLPLALQLRVLSAQPLPRLAERSDKKEETETERGQEREREREREKYAGMRREKANRDNEKSEGERERERERERENMQARSETERERERERGREKHKAGKRER